MVMPTKQPASPNPWQLYDELIDGIPAGISITDFCVGRSWTYVEAACGMGISKTVAGGARAHFDGDPRDLDLRALAALAKSWNFVDATLGIAALNAWYATPEKVAALGGQVDAGVRETHDASNPLRGAAGRYAGKKVVIVGHFPQVEAMAREASVTVLERNCTSALDTPDPACEYLIPEADIVLATGTTLTNKTAPRLLALAREAGAWMELVGPSSVPHEALFAAGASVIAGSIVVDAASAKFAVKGGSKADWRGGIHKFWLERPEA